jgi:hypothetical protein
MMILVMYVEDRERESEGGKENYLFIDFKLLNQYAEIGRSMLEKFKTTKSDEKDLSLR